MPQKSIAVLYLPGLGGEYDALRARAISWWPKRYNAVMVPMNWTDKYETLAQKIIRIQQAITQAEGQVILVGESAGAAIGLVVAHENPNVKFVAYCGKIGGAATTGERYYERVPVFRELLPLADAIREKLSDSEKKRMRVVRAYNDRFLSLRDNTIPGVAETILPSIGHLTSIVLGITVLRYALLRAIDELKGLAFIES